MAWRFKASKYKNAAPIVPKPEVCIRDVCVGSYQTYGNNICASASVMAFNWEHVGSSLAVLPLDDCGRKSKTMPLLHAHSDTITDMEFSPFHDGLLATGSQDCLVKLWHIPSTGLTESLTSPECTLSQRQRRVETVGFNPTADGLLHVTSAAVLSLWDLMTQQEAFVNNDHGDVIQSASWRRDGRILATSCKDKKVRIVDPRAASPLVGSASSHQSIKDSRVVWLGDQERILTTGFDAARLRQVIIRDVRNLSSPEKTLELDCSTGVLMPLYDADTCMLFLAGKGDTTIAYMEVCDREPYLIEGIRHSGEQTKGACLVPKRALRVMEGEVNRVLQLTSSMVVPIMYQVPRKTYRDYHTDLYPDTPGFVTHTNSSMWLKGVDHSVPKMSLDPAKRGPESSEKPRLGPKPFSSSQGSQEFSFDRVFSVPAAPGTQPSSGSQEFLPESQHQNNGCPSPPVSDSAPSSLSPNKQKTSPVKANSNSSPKEAPLDNFASGDKASPTSDVEATPNKDGDYQNGKSDSSIEEEVNSSDSGYKPKTPSTAERRKMFEVKPNSKDGTDGMGAEDAFDDTAVGNQRCSIAERRRLYENRSVSVQETASVAMIAAKEAAAEVAQASPTPLRRRDSLKSRRSPEPEDKRASVPNPSTKRTSTVFGRVSKFRHLKGTPGHKSTHIENIKNVSRQISGECDGFHANPHRVAVPLGGGGGRVAVLELKAAGRLADGVTPALLHPNALCDWQWDPFNHSRLIVACDDGIIREWIIPEEGLSEPTNSPANTFAAHSDKIYLVKFHPCASDVLTTAAHDLTVKLWDLASGGTERLALTGHKDQIFALAWSPCGGYLATVAKDGLIRVYKPRSSEAPIREGKGPVGSRGARVVWALNGSHIVVTGFDKVSERQIMVFDAKDLSTPLNTIGLDVSPAILIPFYDEDSSTLFLTGRGDSTIYCFEVTSEAPHLCPLSHHRCPSLHQGLSFLSKQQCAVQRVEFAKALRLTNTTIEPLSFTVPRIKSELFQDDLFPPTKVSWLPTCSSKEWFSGLDKAAPRLSLQPAGMDTLSGSATPTPITPTSNAPVASNKISNNQPFNRLGWNPEMAGVAKAKQDEIQKSLAARIEVNMTLEQDSMEGVDESEWDQ